MTNTTPVFIPGPTNIPERLRKAMDVPTYDHRAPDFKGWFQPLLQDLKKIFKTRQGEVITFPASGTGGWEAAVANTLSPGDRVLAARIGTFSERWVGLCQRFGIEVELVDCEWGEGTPADRFAEILAADKDRSIKAVLVTHNETATGVTSDVAAVRNALDSCDHPALLFVDAVSSLASIDFKMDDWGVDIAVSGSQKGFMLATGMAIVGVSPKAIGAMEKAYSPRSFFDLRDMMNANKAGGYPYTPSWPLMHGLRESVDMLLEEGLSNVFTRHRSIAEGVRKAVKAWGFELVAKSPDLFSDTVSAIRVPQGFDSNRLTDHAYQAYGMSFGVGLGDVAGKAFRIGHLGMLPETMALSGIATIEMAMYDLDYPIELGSGVAAAQAHYCQAAKAARSMTPAA